MRYYTKQKIAEAGIEPESVTEHDGNELWKMDFVSGAESGAVGARTGFDDVRLARLIEVWPTLPEAVRSSVCELVESTLVRCSVPS